MSTKLIVDGLALFAANFVVFVVENPQHILNMLPVFSSSLPRYPSKITSAQETKKMLVKNEQATIFFLKSTDDCGKMKKLGGEILLRKLRKLPTPPIGLIGT
jgi:hypothetical protein